MVVATTIAQYKFSDQIELYKLFCRVVEGLNLALPLELRTLRDLCNADFGIRSLEKLEDQIDIYRKLIAIAPAERIPCHRLIATLLRNSRLDLADQAIRAAEIAVGLDSPINRYKVRHALMRAEYTEGILREDRIAMLRHAEALALHGIKSFSEDKYSYIAYGEVGEAVADISGDTTVLEAAIRRIRTAADRLLDDLLLERLRQFEDKLRTVRQRRDA